MSSCRLDVEVVSARGLAPLHRDGGSSCYVELIYEGQRIRTTAKQEVISPTWQEHFSFNVLDSSKIGQLYLKAHLYNITEDRRSKTIIGKIRVAVSSHKQEATYGLLKPCIFAHKISGEIHLITSLVHTDIPVGEEETPSSYPIRDGFAPSQVDHVNLQSSACDREDLANGRAIDCGFERKEMSKKVQLVEPIPYIFVHIVRARELPAMTTDRGVDPFVEVSVGSKNARTQHMENTSYPSWDVCYAFPQAHVGGADDVNVAVKHHDEVRPEVVGKVKFHTKQIGTRDLTQNQINPLWYPLRGENGEHGRGEIMLAIWNGNQADEAFGRAICLDRISPSCSVDTSCVISAAYEDPTLWYLRVSTIEAYGIIQTGMSFGDLYVEAKLENQCRRTKTTAQQMELNTLFPCWNEDLLFVVAEPFRQHITLTVQGNNDPKIWQAVVPIDDSIHKRRDESDDKLVKQCPIMCQLQYIGATAEENAVRSDCQLAIRACLEGGHHVMDEHVEASSDLRPAAKELWGSPIGQLELGIIKVEGIPKMKNTCDGSENVNAYCVAKYGKRWVRTRTVIGSCNPLFGEQYSWDVYDNATFLTIGVFDNNQIGQTSPDRNKDIRIGMIRINVCTIPNGRSFAQRHPLRVLSASRIIETGELFVSIRFSRNNLCRLSWLYLKPRLPKMHKRHPIPPQDIEDLRQHAVQIVGTQLSQLDIPLRKEVILCIYNASSSNCSNWWISKVYSDFIKSVFLPLEYLIYCSQTLRSWQNPPLLVLMSLYAVLVLNLFSIWLPQLWVAYMLLVILINLIPESIYLDTRISTEDIGQIFGEEFYIMETRAFEGHAGRKYGSMGNRSTWWPQTLLFLDKVRGLLTSRDLHATKIFVFLEYMFLVLMFGVRFLLYPYLSATYSSVLTFYPFLENWEYYLYPLCIVAAILAPRGFQQLTRKMVDVFVNFFQRLPTSMELL